jgi:tyrosine-protein kinase Etk/Wzc
MNNSENPYPQSTQNYPNHSTPTSDDSVDLRRYFGLFLSNWYWFAISLFIAGLLAYFINNYSERVFTVNASLLIKDDQTNSDISGMDKLMLGGDIFKSQQNLQNEIGILRSFKLNYRVMQQLPEFHVTIVEIGRRGIAQSRHYKSAPFIVVFDTISDQRPNVPVNIKIQPGNTYSVEIENAALDKKTFSFGEKFTCSGFNFKLILRDSLGYKYNPELSNRYLFRFNRPESLANEYRGKLSINPINEDATLVTLSVSGSVPLQEADYLNKLMEVYIKQGMEFKNETAKNTIDFIDEQLKLIADSLVKAENKLESFRLSNNIIDLSSEGTAVRSRLENYTNEKVTATLQKQYFEYLANYIREKNESGEIVSPAVMGVTDPPLLNLVEELALLQAQKKQLKYSFSEDQPAIKLVESKIDDVRKSLAENIKSSINTVSLTIKDVDSRIYVAEQELNKLPGRERELVNIQRTFDLNNTVYTYLLEKRSEAGIAKASNVSSNKIIDRAENFNAARIRPKTRRNYLFALMLGILVPGIYIFLIDQLHNKIFDKKDIERGTRAPIIGFVGHNSSKNDIPVFDKPGSSLSESFRSIRTNLKYYLTENNKAVISVTSTISGEGKTFVSTNLAAVFAMLGKKTLLLGLDLRKPRMNKIFGISSDTGLSSFLIGESNLEEIIMPTVVPNLYFIPSGLVPPNPAELIESDRMKLLIEKVREEFDYIILDTPPVGIVSDALLLSSFADINIFVIRQRFSFKSTLELIQNILEKKEMKNLTIAVNDIHISGYYGYGLRYGYGFYEGYGYRYGYSQYGAYGYGDYHKYYNED